VAQQRVNGAQRLNLDRQRELIPVEDQSCGTQFPQLVKERQ